MEEKKKKAALHNLGCKVNAYETEVMEQLLREAGYEITAFAPGADVYIINTCTVTNIADRKSRQMLHKAKKMNPEAVVVSAGCYSETGEECLEKDPAIDIILGNNKKREIVKVLEEYYEKNRKIKVKADINHTDEYEEVTLGQMSEHTRAYIKVQDGCSQFCTYCIIPYARGRVRSRKIGDVREEIQKIAAQGFQEVVITGIHLSSYGVDFVQGDTLIEVIEAAASIEGIERVRLGSLEPRIITREFLERLSRIKEFCPHFHLSLQSGCNSVLRRMNRKYTTEEYKEGCTKIREVFADAAVTTDVIVGFPQETEEEFAATAEFLREIHFAEMHIFKYSKRRGTIAAAMEGQIPDEIKNRRSAVLLSLERELREEYRKRFVGRTLEVLFEEKETIDEKEYFVGYTREYIKVAVSSKKDLSNTLRQVLVREIYNHEILLAEL